MKTLKNILLVGNDWLLHVVAGVFCYLFFEPLIGKFWAIVISALSHVFIDMVPHGHVKSNILEAFKGVLTAIILLTIIWIKIDLNTAFWSGISIFFAIGFDFIFIFAKWWDKGCTKEEIEQFNRWEWLFSYLMYFVLAFNFVMHWFGKAKIFSSLWKEKEIYNCGISGNGLKVSWWNLAQLIISIPLLVYIFSF